MDSKPLKAVVIIVSVLVGLFGVGYLVNRFRSESGEVPAEVLTRPWIPQSLAGSELHFKAPWLLDPSPVKLPPQISKNVESSSALSLEKDGLYIHIVCLKMVEHLPLSLEGGANGMTSHLGDVSGTMAVGSSRKATTVSGIPAYDVLATIRKGPGKSLALRGTVVIRGQTMYQVILIYRFDQERGVEVWARLRDSLELRD
jgi:hypothetical protein